MANEQEKLAAAKSCFEYNTDASELFMTSDLNCFFNKNRAANHASGLAVKTIDHFTRSTDPIADPANEAEEESIEVTIGDIAEYTAAKDQFSELYQKWNGLTLEEQSSEDGEKLSDQLSALHDAISKYEAENPAAVADTSNETQIDNQPTQEASTDAVAPAIDATTEQPPTADTATEQAPAADPAAEQAPTADAATEQAPAAATEQAPTADATTEQAPAADDTSAPAADEHEDAIKHIVEELVDEVESLLGAKGRAVKK